MINGRYDAHLLKSHLLWVPCSQSQVFWAVPTHICSLERLNSSGGAKAKRSADCGQGHPWQQWHDSPTGSGQLSAEKDRMLSDRMMHGLRPAPTGAVLMHIPPSKGTKKVS